MVPGRVLGVVLMILGAALVVGGIASWVLLGPTGRWEVESSPVDASAVVLSPETLQRINGSVTVSMDAAGPLVAAQAPASDIEALVHGSDVARLANGTGLPSALQVTPGKGSAFAGIGSSEALSEVRTGTGSVSIDVPRDLQRSVLLTAKDHPLRDAVVTVTYADQAWTTLATSSVVVGIVLALLGWWRSKSARPKHTGAHR